MVINAEDLSFHHWIVGLLSRVYHKIFGGESAYSESSLKNRIIVDLTSHGLKIESLEKATEILDFAITLDNAQGMSELAVATFNHLKQQINLIGDHYFSPEEMNSNEQIKYKKLLSKIEGDDVRKKLADFEQQIKSVEDTKTAKKEREIPLSRAMLLFKNFNTWLAPEGTIPLFSTLLESWIKYTEKEELQTCLELVKNIENGHVPDCLPKTAYFPLYILKNKTFSLTIMKVKDGVLYDVVSGQNIECSDFSLLMNWNNFCFKNRFLNTEVIPKEIQKLFNVDGKSQPMFISEASFHKPMKIFHQNNQLLRFEHKWSLLEKITAHPSWITTPHLLQWVKGSLVNLCKHLNKLDDKRDYAIKLQRLRNEIERSEDELSSRLLPYCVEHPKEELISLDAIGETQPKPKEISTSEHQIFEPPAIFQRVDPPKELPDFTKSNLSLDQQKEEAEKLQKWVYICQQLFDLGDFDQLERMSQQFLMALPNTTDSLSFFSSIRIGIEDFDDNAKVPQINTIVNNTHDFYLNLFEFKRFFMDFEEIQALPLWEQKTVNTYSFNGNLVNCWSIPFFRITYFALHCQIIKGRLSPEALKPILKGLALHARLSSIATTQDRHASSPVLTHQMSSVLQGLQNGAADLGDQGAEILELLKVFRAPYQIANRKSTKAYHSGPIFGCNDQIAACQFHELLAFTDMLCNLASMTQQWRGDYNTGQYFMQSQMEAEQAFREGITKLKKGQMMRIGYRHQGDDAGFHLRHAILFPFDSLYTGGFSFDQQFLQEHTGGLIIGFEHLSPPIQNPILRDFVQMGLVTTKNELARNSLGVHETAYRYEKKSAYEAVQDVRSFCPNPLIGENQTQASILNSVTEIPGISREVFQELQLMQTSSLSRADNTLHVFSKHPYLLNHLMYGQDFRTILSLNLFRDSALYREFENRPEQIQEHFHRFEQIIDYHLRKNNKKVLIFLFDVHLKMTNLLKKSGKEWAQKPLLTAAEKQQLYQTMLHTWLQTKTDLDPGLVARTILLQHVGSEKLLPPINLFELTTLFRNSSYYFKSPEEIRYHIHRMIAPQLESLSETITSENINQIFQRKNIKEDWKQENKYTWTSGPYTFHLDTQELKVANEITAPLPREISSLFHLRELFGSKAVCQTYTQKAVFMDRFQGWHVKLLEIYVSLLFCKQARFSFNLIEPKKEK